MSEFSYETYRNMCEICWNTIIHSVGKALHSSCLGTLAASDVCIIKYCGSALNRLFSVPEKDVKYSFRSTKKRTRK